MPVEEANRPEGTARPPEGRPPSVQRVPVVRSVRRTVLAGSVTVKATGNFVGRSNSSASLLRSPSGALPTGLATISSLRVRDAL